MLDVLPKVLLELREDPAVDAIVDGRVRGFEPGPGDADRPFKPFVVVATLASPRFRRLPVQRPRIAVRCYGRTPQEAAALYGACSDALHNVGPRVHANGLGIYASFDDTGGTQEKDPDTDQPLVTFVVDLIATTQVVAS